MKLKLFSVYDSKTNTFSAPFGSPTTPAAVRTFHEMARDSQSFIGKWPEDYTLFFLGSFEDSTAGFQLDGPERLVKASELLAGDASEVAADV